MIFGVFAIVGIALEIWGFIWILRYNRVQKASEFQKWVLKQGYTEDWVGEIPRERRVLIDNDLDINFDTGMEVGNEGWTVPKAYCDYCERRRKSSIILVIIGLCGQMVQVAGSDVFI